MLGWAKKFWQLPSEHFVFWASLIFYFLLYFNINNKTLLILFVFFLFIFWRRLKNLLFALFILYLLFLPFGKGKTFEFVLIPNWLLNTQSSFNYGFTLTFADLAFMGLFILIAREEFRSKFSETALQLGKKEFCFFLFFVFVFLSIFFSQFQIISFLAFLKLMRIAASYFLVRYLLLKEKLKDLLPFVLVSTLIFEGVWASLQFLLQRPLGKSIEPVGGLFSPYGHLSAEDQSFFRSQGTFEHPNTLAVFLTVMLVFFLVRIFGSERGKASKIYLVGFFCGLLGLIFSSSRASWVVFLVLGFSALVYLKRKGRLFLNLQLGKYLRYFILVLPALLVVVVLPRMEQLYLTVSEYGGVYYRTYLIEKAWLLVLDSPFGIGLATFPAVLIDKFGFFTWPTPVHNLFLEIMTETGFFSFVFFSTFLILNYKLLFLNLNRFKDTDFSLKAGALFASLSFLLASQFYPFYWSSGVFEYFWLFLGIMVY